VFGFATMKHLISAALLVVCLAPPGLARAISAAAPVLGRQTKVTWGAISRIDYPQDGSGAMRIFVATPSGEREFDLASSVPLRDLGARTVGFAGALRPGDRVRVYFDVGPNGETTPVDITAEPPGAP
jgi:hypothetical protein